jgi:hypothetical protein
MEQSIEQYNSTVNEAQAREGRLASVDAMGSRLHKIGGEAQ